MIKVFLVFVLIFSSLYAKADIDKKIKKASGKIKNVSKSYSNINKKMAKNAKDILAQKREISKQRKTLKKLVESLSLKEVSYKKNSKKLLELKKEQEILKLAQEKIEEELIFTLAKSISLKVILEENNSVAEESLMEVEVVKSMLEKTKRDGKLLNEEFYENSLVINKVNKHASSLETSINNIDKKRKRLIKIQKKNKK